MKYIAQLCFKITHENSISGYDLQWRIIEADSLEDALFSAKELGMGESISFINEKGIKINWDFSAVLELNEMKDLTNGSLVFSQHVEEKETEGFELYIERKSKDLALQITKNKLSFHL